MQNDSLLHGFQPFEMPNKNNTVTVDDGTEVELYLETVFSSRDNNRLIFIGYVRPDSSANPDAYKGKFVKVIMSRNLATGSFPAEIDTLAKAANIQYYKDITDLCNKLWGHNILAELTKEQKNGRTYNKFSSVQQSQQPFLTFDIERGKSVTVNVFQGHRLFSDCPNHIFTIVNLDPKVINLLDDLKFSYGLDARDIFPLPVGWDVLFDRRNKTLDVNTWKRVNKDAIRTNLLARRND